MTGERHTRQGLARGQREDPYYADRDYGSYTATNTREKARGTPVEVLDRRLGNPYMNGAPLPCRLCQPDAPCSFHDGTP